MRDINSEMIRDLREKTGAGMMDCKTALTETNGDFEKAVDWLRKKGLARAAKKAGRTAAELVAHASQKPAHEQREHRDHEDVARHQKRAHRPPDPLWAEMD